MAHGTNLFIFLSNLLGIKYFVKLTTVMHGVGPWSNYISWWVRVYTCLLLPYFYTNPDPMVGPVSFGLIPQQANRYSESNLKEPQVAQLLGG